MIVFKYLTYFHLHYVLIGYQIRIGVLNTVEGKIRIEFRVTVKINAIDKPLQNQPKYLVAVAQNGNAY